MIYYYFPVLLALLMSQLPEVKQKKTIFIVLFTVTAIVYCSGYMVGSDWRYYEVLYNNASFSGFFGFAKEKGFYLLVVLFNKIGFDFFIFTIFIKSLCLLSIFYFSKKELSTSNKQAFFLFVVISLQGAFLLVNSPFRNVIAIGIFLFAYTKYYKNNFRLYCILCLLGATMHVSLLFVLLATIFARYIESRRYVNYVLFMFFASIVISLFPSIVKDFILLLSGISMLVSTRADGYVSEVSSYSFIQLGSIANILFFIFIYIYRRKLSPSLFVLSCFSLIFYRLYFVIDIFSRFYLYLFPFFAVSISVIVFDSVKGFWYKLLISIYCLATVFMVVSGSYAYLPYSNYWVFYASNNLKSYSYRNNYNIKNWLNSHDHL